MNAMVKKNKNLTETHTHCSSISCLKADAYGTVIYCIYGVHAFIDICFSFSHISPLIV